MCEVVDIREKLNGTERLVTASGVIAYGSDEGIILLRKHPRSKYNGKKYVSPGGKVEVELAETYTETAIREVWEETGLEVAFVEGAVYRRDRIMEGGDRDGQPITELAFGMVALGGSLRLGPEHTHHLIIAPHDISPVHMNIDTFALEAIHALAPQVLASRHLHV